MTTPKEPREFILHGGYTVIFDKAEVVYVSESSKKIDDTLDIHVIEHAAYEVVCAERDNAVAALNHPTSERMGHLIRERDEARVEIERLTRVIARELTENDELGCEYTYVNALRDDLETLSGSITRASLAHAKKDELLSKYEAALTEIKNGTECSACSCTCHIVAQAALGLRGEE